MRITFLTTQINLKTGGGSNLTPHLKASSMRKLGYEVRMITFFPEKNAFLEKPPYFVIESPTKFKNWLMLQLKIFFVLKKYENTCDVFAFEGEHFIWGAGLYRLLNGKTPILLHFNGPIFSIYENGTTYKAEYLPKKSIKAKISFWLRIIFEKNIGLLWANNIDIFTADSPLIKNWHENFGFDKNKIVVLPEFVDLESYFKKSAAESAAKKDKINLIYVGRLAPEKGVDTLLTAIKEMKNKTDVLVRIVGDGRQKEELIKLAREYKIENTVIFYPWADKKTLADLYHCSDIFVHPARWAEPFGVTIVEAMASGLPVITPKISGSSWAAGEGGLTFENGDSEDLKNKIEKLVNDENLRKKLAGKAKKRAEQFDYRNYIKTLENLIKKIAIT
ncbi:MAG: glycosyltransferase family 4 protein [Candidatus Harrisonbacteria bacterium]|nr:glycosyltransferase family 4 protein [Candidatus Harrisonbacteria bacterium]